MRWSGGGSGCPPAASPCIADTRGGTVTIDARFDTFPFTAGSVPGTAAVPPPMRWISELDSPEAAGLVFLNGGSGTAVRSMRTDMTGMPSREQNRVEAGLTQARVAGTWRFEVPARIEPGSLKPLRGEVLVNPDSLVLTRVQGRRRTAGLHLPHEPGVNHTTGASITTE